MKRKPDNKPSRRKLIYIDCEPVKKRKQSIQQSCDAIGYTGEKCPLKDGVDSYVVSLGI